MDKSKTYQIDCMEAMSKMKDNAFDLAMVDPPYFSGPEKRGYYGRNVSSIEVKRVNYPKTKKWKVPTIEYYNELCRVSRHQIIWGINFFNFPVSPGRIVWDKVNDKSSYSDCEIAFCSKIDSTRIFRFMWNGMQQGKGPLNGHIMQGDKSKNEERIHPTQKPVALYKWSLMKFAEEGDTILDTHLGSGSSRIACFDMGFDFVGLELDPDHYKNEELRFKHHIQQQSLFQPSEQYS